ncbi:MAG: ATP-binding protein [Bacteroidota bacterium]
MEKNINVGFFCEINTQLIGKLTKNLKDWGFLVEYFIFKDIFEYNSRKHQHSIDVAVILLEYASYADEVAEYRQNINAPIVVISDEITEFDASLLIKKGISLVFHYSHIDHFAREIDKLLKYEHSRNILLSDQLNEDEKTSALEREITAILKEEGMLREHHIFMQTILENIPSLIYVKDTATMKYLYVNKSAIDIIEFSPDEMIGKTVFELFHPKYAEYYHSKDIELVRSNISTQTVEEMCLTKNNKLKVLLTKKILIKNSKGEPRYFLGISEDLTQLYRSQEELLKSETRFSKIFHSSPVPIFIISNKKKIFVDTNIKCTEFFGVNRDRAIGQPLDVFSEFKNSELMANIYDAIENNKSFVNKQITINFEGVERHILLSCEQLQLPDDIWSVFITLDVTDRINAEREMQAALAKQQDLNKLRTQFISMVSHEFRTPLTTIMLSADMLGKYYDKIHPEERQKQIERIKETIQKMTNLMENLLVIGRIDSGNFQFKPKECNLEQLCSNLIKNAEFNSGFSHKINFNINGNCKNAIVDDQLVSFALNNLLSNAIKYSPNSKVIDFTVNCNEQMIEFIVTDYGIGIPEEEQHLLTQSFYRASNVGQISGYGLGMSIVSRAVEAHCGQIEINSKPGSGSTFIVKLPQNCGNKSN